MPHLPLDLGHGIGSMCPCCLDQFFEGWIPSLLQRPHLDVTRSLANSLKQVVLIVKSRAEQESKSDVRLHRRNVADPPERRVVKRVADCVIVKELVRSRHRLSCHLAQLYAYPSYLIRIVRKKLSHNINQRQPSPRCLDQINYSMTHVRYLFRSAFPYSYGKAYEEGRGSNWQYACDSGGLAGYC